MKRIALVTVVVAALAATAAAVGYSSAAAPASSAVSASTFKVGLSTDIGGLNDRSFNHLAYVGLQRAAKRLGVQTRVVQAARRRTGFFARGDRRAGRRCR